jgi:membrane protein
MQVFKLLKKTFLSWNNNDPWAQSGTIAYYALFSLPSLSIITVYVAGIFLGREAVQGKITEEIGGLIGRDSAQAVEEMIAKAALEQSSFFEIAFGVSILIFAATGVFFQLQKALNKVWSVQAKKASFKTILKKRATSFGVILAIGLLLIISLLLSAIISAFSDVIAGYYSNISSAILEILNFVLSEFFIWSLFATIYTVLPDVKIKWKTTLLGAFIASMLFLVGKYALGYYFSETNPGSVYGAAGSIVLILLWVYYTCLILFFGAEFIKNWALFKNIEIKPTSNATFYFEKEVDEYDEYKSNVDNGNAIKK